MAVADIRRLAPLTVLLAAGLAGTAVALDGHSSDAQFLQDQRHPPNLRQQDVERVVRSAPDPQTGRGRGVAATCSRGGRGELGNPWACVVSYASGKRQRLRVRVLADGTYEGEFVGVRGAAVSGCCIDLPGAP